MAKTKSRSGAAPGAPKPKIEPRKPPLISRKALRLWLLTVAVLGTVVIVVVVLGNMGRSNALEAYDEALERAVRPFAQHNATGAPDSFIDIPARFQSGEITPARLDESAERWVADFAEAAANVRALDPPVELDAANEMMASALDAYGGIASQLMTLADQKRLESDARGAQRRALRAQFTAWASAISAARTRADALLAAGQQVVTDLKVAWGLQEPPPGLDDVVPQPTLPIPEGLPIPDGG